MKADLPRYVLDSSGSLAYFGGEPGEAQVKVVLERAAVGQAEVYLSVVNLGEVAYIIEREQGAFSTRRALAVSRSVAHQARSRPIAGWRLPPARQGAPRVLLRRCLRRGAGAADGRDDPHGRPGIRQDRARGRGGVAAAGISAKPLHSYRVMRVHEMVDDAGCRSPMGYGAFAMELTELIKSRKESQPVGDQVLKHLDYYYAGWTSIASATSTGS